MPIELGCQAQPTVTVRHEALGWQTCRDLPCGPGLTPGDVSIPQHVEADVVDRDPARPRLRRPDYAAALDVVAAPAERAELRPLEWCKSGA